MNATATEEFSTTELRQLVDIVRTYEMLANYQDAVKVTTLENYLDISARDIAELTARAGETHPIMTHKVFGVDGLVIIEPVDY